MDASVKLHMNDIGVLDDSALNVDKCSNYSSYTTAVGVGDYWTHCQQ